MAKRKNSSKTASSKTIAKELQDIERELNTAAAEADSAKNLCVEIMGDTSEPGYRAHGAEALIREVERRIDAVTRRLVDLRAEVRS